MDIFVYKDGRQLGPYTQTEITTAIAQGEFGEIDNGWTAGLENWVSLGSLVAGKWGRCPQCEGQLILEVEHPNRGTGAIVIVLGILLAPVCVGFILIIWGLILALETKSQWHCRGCGRLYPA
jgi:hypothetical protein